MIDKKYIKELAELLNENDLTEISVKDGEKELTLKKGGEMILPPPPMAMPAPVAAVTTGGEQLVCTPAEKKGTPVKSPMVGTFYKASSPDSKPFAEVGTTIKEGQVVCIIEAMKLMNEIEADVSGKVVEICVEDCQAVEYGQVLMYVE